MEFGEISIKDKLGRTVILRNARPEDSAALIEYLRTTSAETPYLIREPEEIKGGIILLEASLIEDEKLLERPVFFTYCNIDTRKVRIPGGGFTFLASGRYGQDRHAENQQCTSIHIQKS